ncbi:MAG: helix-turn-helix transcriptional regulator, partial [Sulfobacillus sp.]
QQFDPPYSTQAESGRHKIESVLPARVRARVDEFRESTKILHGRKSRGQYGVEMTVLARIRGALLTEKKVRFRYVKPSSDVYEDRETERTVAPYGLALVHGTWMLIAHCDLRNDIRHFRLSRIRDVAVLDEPFERPADFELRRYVPKDDRQLLIRLQFQPHLRDAVLESNSFFMESMTTGTDAIDVTLRVRQPQDVLKWVLSWGAGVEVTEPHAFRLQVRSEIENMLRRY